MVSGYAVSNSPVERKRQAAEAGAKVKLRVLWRSSGEAGGVTMQGHCLRDRAPYRIESCRAGRTAVRGSRIRVVCILVRSQCTGINNHSSVWELGVLRRDNLTVPWESRKFVAISTATIECRAMAISFLYTSHRLFTLPQASAACS
jgi:hypothetical protein